MKKSYIAAALALTGCMVVGAAAVSQPQNVVATFRPDITLEVNGTAYNVRDTNGNLVSPLIYNGTTYLPLSSLGQLLDVDVSWDAATSTVVVHDADTASTLIGEAKAKEIALNHANVSSSKASFRPVKLDWENGRQVYEVEFYSGSTEYDYEIDASTGSIVGYDHDIENYTIPSTGTSTNLIGEAKAKEIALNHAGLTSSKVSFVQAKLDWDDGRQVYDVDFYSGSKEYDYEIDAATGSILSYDYDIENYSIPSASQSGDYISKEKAQQLAQAKAPNATLVKLEFDYDDGRAIYEGELRDGRTEYDFEIDAVTGSFLKWEQDWDD
ncbi:PepSY domain-containing protein [Lawsonibacter sp. LCP25S3_G6]|uniref:PepSY domain-containing protein n=1 Tax=unclassified Lawsonibacter TaxID=2617946 RepID=UPI003F97AE7A